MTDSVAVCFVRACRAKEIPPGSVDVELFPSGPLTAEELRQPHIIAAQAAYVQTGDAWNLAIKVKGPASRRARDIAAFKRRTERALVQAKPLEEAMVAASKRRHNVRLAASFERQPDPGFQAWWRACPLRAVYLP